MNSIEDSSYKLCCNNCNKQYTRKTSLEKHKILCDFKMKSSREHQIEIDELGDIPTHYQLVKIVQELTLKLNKMENQMEQMKKWVDKKKRKLNIVLWLNANINPTIGFLEWVHTDLIVNARHFEMLLDKDNSIFYVIQQIFENNLSNKVDFVYPIRCFTEKAGAFYICDKKGDGSAEWCQLEFPDMLLMLKRIQNGLIKELTKWKTENQDKMNDNDKIAIIFQKAIIKITSISFSQDNNLSRIKNGLYNYLKTDLKSVEFEFEFEF